MLPPKQQRPSKESSRDNQTAGPSNTNGSKGNAAPQRQQHLHPESNYQQQRTRHSRDTEEDEGNYMPDGSIKNRMDQVKDGKPKPIDIPGIVTNYTAFSTALKRLVPELRLVHLRKTGGVRILVQRENQWAAVWKYLKDENIHAETHAPPSKQSFQVVIRGLPRTMDETEIHEGLTALQIIPDNIYQMRRIDRQKNKVHLLSLFRIRLKSTPRNKQIWNLKRLCLWDVTVEQPDCPGYAICQRCTGYKHTKEYCTYPVECARCPDYHWTSECPYVDERPWCRKCETYDHYATSRSCPTYKEWEAQQTHQPRNLRGAARRNLNQQRTQGRQGRNSQASFESESTRSRNSKIAKQRDTQKQQRNLQQQTRGNRRSRPTSEEEGQITDGSNQEDGPSRRYSRNEKPKNVRFQTPQRKQVYTNNKYQPLSDEEEFASEGCTSEYETGGYSSNQSTGRTTRRRKSNRRRGPSTRQTDSEREEERPQRPVVTEPPRRVVNIRRPPDPPPDPPRNRTPYVYRNTEVAQPQTFPPPPPQQRTIAQVVAQGSRQEAQHPQQNVQQNVQQNAQQNVQQQDQNQQHGAPLLPPPPQGNTAVPPMQREQAQIPETFEERMQFLNNERTRMQGQINQLSAQMCDISRQQAALQDLLVANTSTLAQVQGTQNILLAQMQQIREAVIQIAATGNNQPANGAQPT